MNLPASAVLDITSSNLSPDSASSHMPADLTQEIPSKNHGMVASGGSVKDEDSDWTEEDNKRDRKRKSVSYRKENKTKKKQKKTKVDELHFFVAKMDQYDFEEDLLGFKRNSKHAAQIYDKQRAALEYAVKRQIKFDKTNPQMFLQSCERIFEDEYFVFVGEKFKVECLINAVPMNILERWDDKVSTTKVSTMKEVVAIFSECFIEEKSLAEEMKELFRMTSANIVVGSHMEIERRNIIERLSPLLKNVPLEQLQAAIYINDLSIEDQSRVNEDPQRVWQSISEVSRFIKPFQKARNRALTYEIDALKSMK